MTNTYTHADWMQKAIDLSKQSPADKNDRFKVGAIILDNNGDVVSHGFTHELDNVGHAEEVAIQKANDKSIDLSDAVIYTTLEPCSERASRPLTCTELIIASGIQTVIYAYKEPPIFVTCNGAEMLENAGIKVIELSDFADQVKSINAHLIKDSVS